MGSRSARLRTVALLATATLLAGLIGACSSDEPVEPVPIADDRGLYAAASALRICGATSSGLAQAATQMAEAAGAGDMDAVTALVGPLRNQGGQLEKVSKSGATTLEGHVASDETKDTREDGLALYGRCTVLGVHAQELADTAEAADPAALDTIAQSATQTAAEAQGVANDVEEFANALPKP